MVKYTPISGIYVILNTKNKKVYIGQSKNIRDRLRRHRGNLKRGVHCNIILQQAWDKYGEAAFRFFTLEYCSVEQLDAREQHHLDVYFKQGICYNIAKDASAPMRGISHNKETRQKLSRAMQGKKFTEEHRRGISESNRRRKISPETREKMSIAAQNRSLEHRQRLSIANKGKIVPEDRRQKISDGLKEKYKNDDEFREKIRNTSTGRKHSEETKRKIGDANKNKVVSAETRKKISDAKRLRDSIKRKQDSGD